MDTTGGAPAGWYADPAGGPDRRWWDGTQWTEHRSPATDPAAAGTEHRPEPAPVGDFGAVTGPPAAAPPAFGTAPPYGGTPTYGGTPAYNPNLSAPPGAGAPAAKPRGKGRRVLMAVAFLVSAALSAAAVSAILNKVGGDPEQAVTAVDTPTTTADPTTDQTPAPAPPAPDGKTFTDPDGVYEITVAPTWKTGPAPSHAIELWTIGTSGANVNINDLANPQHITLAAGLRAMGSELEKTIKGLKVDGTDTALTPDGQKVGRLHVTNSMMTAGSLKQEMYLYITPSRIITVTVSARVEEADEVFAAADPYALSLRPLGTT